MSRARNQVDIAATAAQVMAVVTDFAAYPDFLPWLRRVQILRHEPARAGRQENWEVRFEAQVIRPLVYTLRLEREGDAVLRWSLVEGSFLVNDGAWTLSPLDDGLGTRAVYELDLQTGSFVPSTVMRSLVGRDLPDLLERVRAETQRRTADP